MDKNNQNTKCIHIFVTGKVQGVGFRAYVKAMANRLGVSGWVRNVGYKQVETIAEGNPDILNLFVEAVRAGPRSSRVDDLTINWEIPCEDYKNFEIRYD